MKETGSLKVSEPLIEVVPRWWPGRIEFAWVIVLLLKILLVV